MSDLLPQYSGSNELTMPGFLVQLSNDGVPIQQVSSVSEIKHSREDLSVFFGIGLAVNVILVVTFFVWAFKQWRKNDTSEK